MKDAFGYNFWMEEAKEWFAMAADAHRKGFLHLRDCFHKLGLNAKHTAEECI